MLDCVIGVCADATCLAQETELAGTGCGLGYPLILLRFPHTPVSHPYQMIPNPRLCVEGVLCVDVYFHVVMVPGYSGGTR